jgi:hypothetical protein
MNIPSAATRFAPGNGWLGEVAAEQQDQNDPLQNNCSPQEQLNINFS